MTKVLELRGVSKKFDEGDPAVDDVWLALDPGELHALLGPSGCGKTTILRMIAGFETPMAGEILLDGSPIARLPPYERNVTTVFQSYALFPHMTVRENVEFGLKRKPVPGAAARVAEILDLVQLVGLTAVSLCTSKPQQRRYTSVIAWLLAARVGGDHVTESEEIDRIIAEVAKKHRILLKPTDPVFLFVTAARSVLERSFARLDQQMLDRLAAFDQSIRAVEIRAGRVLD